MRPPGGCKSGRRLVTPMGYGLNWHLLGCPLAAGCFTVWQVARGAPRFVNLRLHPDYAHGPGLAVAMRHAAHAGPHPGNDGRVSAGG